MGQADVFKSLGKVTLAATAQAIRDSLNAENGGMKCRHGKIPQTAAWTLGSRLSPESQGKDEIVLHLHPVMPGEQMRQ